MKFENLEIWQRSYSLAVDVYKTFSHCRDFGFKNQITRSALSGPSDISEGGNVILKKKSLDFYPSPKALLVN